MTSISQHTQLSSQATSKSTTTPSYSSAAKKAVTSPTSATGSSIQSPTVAVGYSGSVQSNHGKSLSHLSLNGKSSISPAVPVVSAPAIAHSGSVSNGTFNHNRKPSVTIGANGPNSMNGGPASGSGGKIQFGSITDSPALSHSSPQIYQPTASAPVSTPNQRICDPSHSPSPIPQPSASGGRPPVVGPGNGVNFGSFGGDADVNCHNRRDSSQSGQSDMSNHQARGGFPQAGRGRGGFQTPYQPQQMGGYPPPNNSFRNSQSQGRGMPPFQAQGRPPFPNSPHQASRGPALPNSSISGTSNMNPSIPMPNQQQMPPYYPQHITGPQYNYQYDPRAIPMQNSTCVYPQMAYMQNNTHSPQAAYQQPHFTPGPYAPQAQQMSRNSSQISDHRPASRLGQPPQAPSIPTVMHSLTPQAKPNVTNSQFPRRPRKSAAIPIKKPDGEALDIESIRSPASPAPSIRARTPPVITSIPTPPPKTMTHLPARSDNVGSKTSDQIKQEMMDKVKKAATEESLTTVDSKEPEEKINISSGEPEVKEITKIELVEKAEKKVEEPLTVEVKEKVIQTPIVAVEASVTESEHAGAERNEITLDKNPALNATVPPQEEKVVKQVEKDVKPSSVNKKETIPSKSIPSKSMPSTNLTKLGTTVSVSDESMAPPPKITSLAAEKRINKPTSLNLMPLDGKTIEAPQPSAALKSLKSARYLTVFDKSVYPSSILSPNPALNQAVKDKGKSFKYDKEFLLQFQKVFVEKPSLEFESQIKALIGDTESGSSRTGSTRAAEGMGSRSNSSRNTSAFNSTMGSFSNSGGGKTLPPGTTSEQRYANAMAGGSMQRPQISAMASFNNRPRSTAFPAGNTMSRNPSNSSVPHSPRQPSRRGNTSSKGYNSSNAKQDSQAAKTMPLTAGMELKPIQISATGWKPRSIGASGPAPGASATPGHMDPDMVQRKVKAALNKMTPEKFDKIADQILAIAAQSKDEADGRTLRQVIQLTFEKATDEAHWASMYAKFCKRMLETMSSEIKDETILDKSGKVVFGGNLFRKYLLNRCQEEFERGWKMDLPDKPDGERGDEKTEEAVMLSDEYYIAAAAKRRGLGLVQFIGELYKLGMLTERIMHECVKKLVDYTGIPDEAEIESLTKLLKTIGFNLDNNEKGKGAMDAYFQRIQIMIDTPELPSRLRFMLMDIVDLRKKRWASKESNKGPKTLEEVRVEAEAAAAQKAAESARSSQRGGTGGGGRSHIGGRGDGRNFSNQFGMQAPPDHQKNMVGVDDLRRLTNRNNNPRQLNQHMSFGPTSMYSRTNSGRKMGPGGSFGRAGEDSGPSSRTGTPPQQREKESATSVNTFSLLAGLGSGETDNPASPPSAAVSPAMSRATLVSTEKSEQ